MLRPLACLLISAATLAPAAALAQVSLAIEAQKQVTVKDAAGRASIQLVEPTQVTPGDQIAYAIRVTNSGAKAAENIRFVTPVPAEMAYRGGSAGGGDVVVAFSVDRGRTFDAPERLFVAEAGQRRPARPSEYTHIQWRFATPLAAGATRTVTYQALVR